MAKEKIQRSVRQQKSIKKPMSKKIKIILSCVISSVVLIGAIIGLVVGLNSKKTLFDYLTLEVDTRTDTFIITDVSEKLKGEITIPEEYKGRKITIIGNNAFYRSNITKLNLPNSITNFGTRAFMKAGNLKTINVPENLYTIGSDCFMDCVSLESFGASEVTTTIGDNAFRNCQALESFTFNEKVINVGSGVFGHCYNLEKIEISESVRNIGGPIFTYCLNLTEIKVADGNVKYEAVNNCLIDKEAKNVISGCKTSEIPEGVVSIGESSFEGIRGLTKATIPSSVTEIKTCAFYGCELLGTECNGFVDISSVQTIGRNAFTLCSSLTRVELAGLIEELAFSVFTNCKNLETVVISAVNLKTLPVQTFYDCDKLSSVSIINNLEVIGQYAFGRCKLLTTLSLPSSLLKIESSAFEECIGLTDIYIPSGVTEIQDFAFNGCKDDLNLLMQASSKNADFGEKWNYNRVNHELTTLWGQTAN